MAAEAEQETDDCSNLWRLRNQLPAVRTNSGFFAATSAAGRPLTFGAIDTFMPNDIAAQSKIGRILRIPLTPSHP